MIVRRSPDSEIDLPAASLVVRWFVGFLCVLFGLVLLLILGGVFFAFQVWAQNSAAARAVEEEVARLRQSGQPMTVEDLYRFHAVPENIADNSASWLAAQRSCNSKKLYAAGTGLPFVGDGDAKLFRPDADNSQLAAAEKLLADFAPALQAILAAAAQPGECRYAVKFEDGVSAVANKTQDVRTVARLLALNVRILAARGKTDEALASLHAMFAAADTTSHQLTITEQMVHFAMLGMAIDQAGFTLNELELTDEQLRQLSGRVRACDVHLGLTRGLIGERALSNLSFDLMGITLASADRKKMLEVMTQAIAISAQEPPADREQLNAMSAAFNTSESAKSQWITKQCPLTALVFPTLTTAFDAKSRILAAREILLTAIACQRYELKTGRPASQLGDLVPDFLPTIPRDPFDGRPLRFRLSDNTIVIYSVGKNGKDDGGQNASWDSSEPDMVLRLRTE
jgi:hypothetical protein